VAEPTPSVNRKRVSWRYAVGLAGVAVFAFWPILVVLGFHLWAPVAMIHETFGVHYVPYAMMAHTYYFVRNAHFFALTYTYLPSAIVHDVLTNVSDVTRFQIYSLMVYAIHGTILVLLSAWIVRSRLSRIEKVLLLLVAFAQPFLTTRIVNALTINYHMLEAVLYTVIASGMVGWLSEPDRWSPRRTTLLGVAAAIAIGTKLSLVAVIVPFMVVLAMAGAQPGRERRRAIAIFLGALLGTLVLGLLIYFRFRPERLLRFARDVIALNLDPAWLDQRVEIVVRALRHWLSPTSATFGFAVVATWWLLLFGGAVLLWRQRRPPRLGVFLTLSAGVGVFLVYVLWRRTAPHSVIDFTLFCLFQVCVLSTVYDRAFARKSSAVASAALIVTAAGVEVAIGYHPAGLLDDLAHLSQTTRELHTMLDTEPTLPVVYYMPHTNASLLFPSVDLYPLVSGEREPLETVYLHYRHPRARVRLPGEGLWPGPHIMVVPEYLPRKPIEPLVAVFALLPPFEMVLANSENTCRSFDVTGRTKLDMQFAATATSVVVCIVRRLPPSFTSPAPRDTVGLVNLAFARAARQSSTFGERTADRAVDGSPGDAGHSDYAQTLHERYPWWQVDLGAVRGVTEIRLWNRADCCQEHLRSFWIFLSTERFTSSDPVTTRHQAGIVPFFVPAVASQPTVLTVNRQGRYIRVQLTEYSWLALGKVEVWGRP